MLYAVKSRQKVIHIHKRVNILLDLAALIRPRRNRIFCIWVILNFFAPPVTLIIRSATWIPQWSNTSEHNFSTIASFSVSGAFWENPSRIYFLATPFCFLFYRTLKVDISVPGWLSFWLVCRKKRGVHFAWAGQNWGQGES